MVYFLDVCPSGLNGKFDFFMRCPVCVVTDDVSNSRTYGR